MKLYSFSKWNKEKSTVQLTEWETDEVFFKKEFAKIKRGWTVIDVGSEFGYYALKAGMLVGSEGKAFAIEIHPETYRLLRMNIKLHELVDRVIPICKAVGGKTGSIRLYETTDPGSTSIVPRQSVFDLNKNRLRMWLEFAKNGAFIKLVHQKFAPTSMSRARATSMLVPLDTLDRIAKEYDIKKINLVKIDVEGAELEVLRGSRDILKKNKPILLVEVHFGCAWKPETVYGLLEKAGYRLTIEKRVHKALVIARPN